MNVILDKELFLVRNLFKNQKFIRNFLYCYLNLFNEKNNIDNNELIRRFEISKNYLLEEVDRFNNFLPCINSYIKKISWTDKNYEFDISKKLKEIYTRFYEILTRSEFNNILLKYQISSNKDFCPRQIFNEERRIHFIKKTDYQIKFEKFEINPIKNFVLKVLEEHKNIKQMMIQEQQKKKKMNQEQKILKYFYDILNYNNLQIENAYEKDEILFILRTKVCDIILKLPFNQIFHLDYFPFEIEVLGKYKFIEQKFEINKNIKKIVLYKKIKELFEDRIKSLFRLNYDELRSFNKWDSKFYDNNFLIDILIRFADYLNNYHMIFKTNCNLCCKKLRYSNNEKCFFPPYYKMFWNKEFYIPPQFKYNDKNNIPIFFHEDCFKKIGFKAI